MKAGPKEESRESRESRAPIQKNELCCRGPPPTAGLYPPPRPDNGASRGPPPHRGLETTHKFPLLNQNISKDRTPNI